MIKKDAAVSGLVMAMAGAALVAPALVGSAGAAGVRAAEPAPTGALRVDVVGAGRPVRIVVTGQHGFRRVVRKDTTLRHLDEDTYRIQASPFVTPMRRPAVTVSKRQLHVDWRTFKVTVTYSPLQPVRRVAVGEQTACAALKSGDVKCWGSNDDALLGDRAWLGKSRWPVSWATTTIRKVRDARAVTLGGGTACALQVDGRVFCWGWISRGGGWASETDTPVPVRQLRDATAVAAGLDHVCALRENGRVVCWGSNRHGQLGSGAGEDVENPVRAEGVRHAIAIAVGGNHSCALLQNGTVLCWGENEYGQVGDGSQTDADLPVAVTGLRRVAAVTAGGEHSCAVLRTGAMKCWGRDDRGQLGDGSGTPGNWSAVPVAVFGIDNAVAAAGGGAHTCARLGDRSVLCWGDNSAGQLGIDSTMGAGRPVPLNGFRAKSLSAGKLNTCAVRSRARVSCWGAGQTGQIGNGRWRGAAVPVSVLGFGSS